MSRIDLSISRNSESFRKIQNDLEEFDIHIQEYRGDSDPINQKFRLNLISDYLGENMGYVCGTCDSVMCVHAHFPRPDTESLVVCPGDIIISYKKNINVVRKKDFWSFFFLKTIVDEIKDNPDLILSLIEN